MGLFNSSAARLARSEVDWRLRGLPVRATTSHAMEATMALSRGGKGRLAASPFGVLEGEVAAGPSLPPAANAVGVEVESSTGGDVGDGRMLVEEQDQQGTLTQMRGSRAGVGQASSLGDEVLWKTRLVDR
jgi:hypothetical protein